MSTTAAAKKVKGPVTAAEEQKTHPVAVRMKPSDVERLVQLAVACGVKHSTLANCVLLDYLNNPRPLIGAVAMPSTDPTGGKKR